MLITLILPLGSIVGVPTVLRNLPIDACSKDERWEERSSRSAPVLLQQPTVGDLDNNRMDDAGCLSSKVIAVHCLGT